MKKMAQAGIVFDSDGNAGTVIINPTSTPGSYCSDTANPVVCPEIDSD